MDLQHYHASIVDYYRKSRGLYKYFWYRGKSRGMHYGFADKQTHNHTEALINQYRYIVTKAQIVKGMSVLDAGCGVGGATVYIAKQTGSHVVGITLVLEQAEDGRKYAKQKGVSHLTEFVVGDYAQTEFKSQSFDVVFGIESICYAQPKLRFLREAYRILKPGGMLVITDGYRKREPRNGREQAIMHDFCSGWRLAGLDTHREMLRALRQAGFENIQMENKTQNISMSLERMRRIVWWWDKVSPFVVNWRWSFLEMARENAKSMRASIVGFETGLIGYFGHVARRPKR